MLVNSLRVCPGGKISSVYSNKFGCICSGVSIASVYNTAWNNLSWLTLVCCIVFVYCVLFITFFAMFADEIDIVGGFNSDSDDYSSVESLGSDGYGSANSRSFSFSMDDSPYTDDLWYPARGCHLTDCYPLVLPAPFSSPLSPSSVVQPARLCSAVARFLLMTDLLWSTYLLTRPLLNRQVYNRKCRWRNLDGTWRFPKQTKKQKKAKKSVTKKEEMKTKKLWGICVGCCCFKKN